MPLYFVARSLRIAVSLPVFTVAFVTARIVRPSAAPGVLRWYLQAQGGVFVKLGQFLAMRYDVLPSEYCLELSKLLDRLPPMPIARVAAAIEGDLGRPVAELFAELAPEALGSASIAQVHRAVLHDGRVVAVKVMRPGVARQFGVDFRWMRLLAVLLDDYLFLASSGISGVMGEVISLTREELDFRREVRNLAEMHTRMAEDAIDHCAPAVVPELCGTTTITMEFLDGVRVADIIEALEAGDEARLGAWADQGLTPRRTAHLILRSVLEQTMHHRLFQADPHAANLVMLPGGTLGWLDFGILGWLDEKLWKEQFELREAVAAEKIHRAYEIVAAMFAPIPRSSARGFETEVKASLRDWINASRSPVASITDKSTGLFFLNVMRSARRAGIRIPTGLARMFRAIIIADVVVLRLDPGLDWMPVMAAFIRDEQERQAEAMLDEALSLPYALDAARLAFSAVPTLLTLVGWVQTSVPEFGREAAAEMSYIESTMLQVFRFARLAAIVLSGVMLVRLLTGQDPAHADTGLVILALSVVATFVLTRLMRVPA